MVAGRRTSSSSARSLGAGHGCAAAARAAGIKGTVASKRAQQTFAKRNRERAVEEKRRLKREMKQAKREAARNGEPLQPEPADDAEQ